MVEFNKEYKTKNGDKAVIFGRIKDKLIGFMETSGGHVLAWHWNIDGSTGWHDYSLVLPPSPPSPAQTIWFNEYDAPGYGYGYPTMAEAVNEAGRTATRTAVEYIEKTKEPNQ